MIISWQQIKKFGEHRQLKELVGKKKSDILYKVYPQTENSCI